MARMRSSSSGQRTSRSTSGSWMPTLIGRSAIDVVGQAPSAAAIARRWSGVLAAARADDPGAGVAHLEGGPGHDLRAGPVDGLQVDELGHARRCDLATRVTSGATACILAMTGMSSSGPFPQLPPMASAPHAAGGERPPRARRPSSCGRACRRSSS